MASKLAFVICRSWTLRSRRALATRSVNCASCDEALVGLCTDSGLDPGLDSGFDSSSSAKSSEAWSKEANPVDAALLRAGVKAGLRRFGVDTSDGAAEPCAEMIRATTGGSAIVKLPERRCSLEGRRAASGFGSLGLV